MNIKTYEKIKNALITMFQQKIKKAKDRVKPIYQSIIDNITNENEDDLCKYFGVTNVKEAKQFVKNVKINWWNRDLIKTKQQFIATAKACKYACKWCIMFDTDQSFLDSLTVNNWNLALDSISEDHAFAIFPAYICEFIVIRNGNKVFAKSWFDQKWLNSIKS